MAAIEPFSPVTDSFTILYSAKNRLIRRWAMRHQTRLVTLKACCLTVIVSSSMIAANLALAAQGRRAPDTPKDLKSKQRETEQREAMLRTVETKAAIEKIDEQRLEADIGKVKEDFKRIQIVRNEMVRNLLAKKPFDYNLISTETEEINRRANRLKKFLMPPVPEGDKEDSKNQIEFDKTQMEDALVRLCNLIANFVDNPVLKTPGRVDVEESTRAGGDLLSIIALSDNIKRSAEKLNKAPR